jgi:apolipoprotein N-acyltransferase
MFALPAAIAGSELLMLIASPHGAAGSLAYSQMDRLPLIQLAALGGVPAIVFLVLLPGSLAGLWLSRKQGRGERWAAAALLGVILGLVAVHGVVRLAASGADRSVAVAAVATDRFRGIPEDWWQVWAAYRPEVLRVATPGGIVVLPEKMALVDVTGLKSTEADLRAAARSSGATIAAGIEVRTNGGYRNRSLLAEPDGRVSAYDKQRLVPGFEDRDLPGDRPLIIDMAGVRLGTAICKDMHVPSIGRQYAARAVLLAVPAWDFNQDGWMGARMTALRGIEGGYGVSEVRAMGSSVSTISPDGRLPNAAAAKR